MAKDYPELDFESTSEIKVSDRIIDQVIGQDKAVKIVKKAAEQRRNVILIGEPGTGKSMLGLALAELLPRADLVDTLCLPNTKDENNPIIKTVPASTGRKIINAVPPANALAGNDNNMMYIMFIVFGVISIIYGVINYFFLSKESDVLQAANRISFTFFVTIFVLGAFAIYTLSKGLSQRMVKILKPKIIVDNAKKDKAPFIDATGAHEGALLGDVRHDPFQSGGLGTPAHERVEAGAIHKANKGVLFIDEIATLKPESQIMLLTAMQDKKLPITGRSERSAGAMVNTEPVPCDFILVAAGNVRNFLEQIHPALRSRMRGYGYEVYINNMIDDTPENRAKFAQFIAQEVKKENGKIPHLNRKAVIEVIKESRRRSGRKNKLSIKFREIGGLIRVAGDIAKEEGADLVTEKHVEKAKELSGSLEKQMVEKAIEHNKEYNVILNKGNEIGRVNGLAVLGESDAGLVMPIEAVVTPTSKEGESKIIATGKLGKIAKEAVNNVFAVIKKYKGKDIKQRYDTHIQFVMSYNGVEGDSASISIATAVISALEDMPVRQDTAMTGSLSVRGEVLPIGGINAKIEAAMEAGVKRVIVPKLNVEDIIPTLRSDGIEIIPVENISDVLQYALTNSKNKNNLVKEIKKIIR
ncbi:MAG: ATP-dependent protease LonB [Nanoarchaeota archaeon]|nr:ATP-dependent protease LonB [Nanoarchaeota archaeon]